MYNSAIDQVKALRPNDDIVIVKLGTVTALSGGKAQIKLYGDSSASSKLYTYIDGYLPEVNDKVALLPQGKTYIIIGKVTDATPTQKWALVNHNHDGVYLPIAYKNKLEDPDGAETVALSSDVLAPSVTQLIDLGTASKLFNTAYIKEIQATTIYANGQQIRMDRIELISGGNTYNLVGTVSSGYVTLTPSANDRWSLGTKSYQLHEAWLGLFRGTWKSGQTTERAIAWNSSNALVPDSSKQVDLGSASYLFKQLFAEYLVGGAWKYNTNAAYNLAWNTAAELLPSTTNAVSLGSSTKQFNKIYAKEFYLNGTLIDISGITLDALTTKYGNTSYTLTLEIKNPGASSQYEVLTPSVNNKFDLGSSSYKFRNIYATEHVGNLGDGTRSLEWNSSHALLPDTNNVLEIGAYLYKIKQIYANYFCGSIRHYTSANNYKSLEWDSSYNFYPDTTNTISLGTSTRQFKNIYGVNLYANGSAVTSDRRMKKDIEEMDERYEELFNLLKPVRFKYKENNSDRYHTGFIAQEIEEAADEAGLGGKGVAIVVRDEQDDYYVRYTEIIAIQTKVIQKLQGKVESLEARIARLESLVERSIK